MGQQQLLLIILSVIIVGVAVVLGIAIFSANAEQTNRDAIITNMQHVAILSQKYYKKPKMLSGGGGSFLEVSTSGVVPKGLLQNANGIISFSTVADHEITLLGTGVETVNGSPIQHQIVVTSDSIGYPLQLN